MAEAKNYGIQLLLSLTNGDTGFGGIEQYVKWFQATSITDFYTNPKIRVHSFALTNSSSATARGI